MESSEQGFRAGQGMGEGTGRKDVSDQLTDEDQLLGSRQKDEPQDQAPSPLTSSSFSMTQQSNIVAIMMNN